MESGSWAEWVGAVATSLTFGGGLLLWRFDVQAKKRALADQLVTWVEMWRHTDEDGKKFHTPKVFAHNAGTAPIPYNLVITRHGFFDRHEGVGFALFNTEETTQVIKPGTTLNAEHDFDWEVRKHTHWISFFDGHGRFWVRNLATGKYMSALKQKIIRINRPFNNRQQEDY